MPTHGLADLPNFEYFIDARGVASISNQNIFKVTQTGFASMREFLRGRKKLDTFYRNSTVSAKIYVSAYSAGRRAEGKLSDLASAKNLFLRGLLDRN